MIRLRAVLCLCLLSAWAAPRPIHAQSEAPPRTPDELLWSEIEALRAVPAATGPAGPRPATATNQEAADLELARRQRLLDRLELYLRLYPGGPRRDEAVVLELETAFEIGALTSGRFDDLSRRANEYCRAPPSPAALHEAAYWRIICRKLERSAVGEVRRTDRQPPGANSFPAREDHRLEAGATSPAPVPDAFPSHDSVLLRELRAYLDEYPSSRRAPRLTEILFEDARQRGDRREMRTVVERLADAQQDHPVAERLGAQLRREEAVGRPFDVQLRLADGSTHEISRDRGRIVVLVVWASFDARSRERLRQVWKAARKERDLRLIGVNLDASAEAMETACRELGVDCPQSHDGRGWASAFALEWGVRELPFVFVVDREGRLVGSTTGENWYGVLERARAD